MTIIGLLVVVFMGVSVYYSVSSMRAIDKRILQEQEINIRKDYDDSIKQQVEQTYNECFRFFFIPAYAVSSSTSIIDCV